MSLRHAVALALVGWYLMVPPLRVTWLDWFEGKRESGTANGISPEGRAPL